MENLIKNALDYIKKNNTLVEIKEYTKWRSQGIVKDIKKADSDFSSDKEIEFINGEKVVIWI